MDNTRYILEIRVSLSIEWSDMSLNQEHLVDNSLDVDDTLQRLLKRIMCVCKVQEKSHMNTCVERIRTEEMTQA